MMDLPPLFYFSRLFAYFYPYPQLQSAMSRKKGLSREELEIQRVLSPGSSGTQSGGVTPGQTGITIHADPAPQAPVAIADESMEKLAACTVCYAAFSLQFLWWSLC